MTDAAESQVDQEHRPVPVKPRSYAMFVAAGIFLSRIAGLIRERAIAHYFGNSPALGAFRAAFRIPNFLQNLFGEGALSASFIPVYARLLAEEKREIANRLAGIVAAMLSLVTAALVLLGVLFAPALVSVLAPGYKGELRDLTIHLVRILFPGAGLLVMSAWCLGILNSHRQFFLSYVAPVLWNVAMIGSLLIFGSRRSGAALAETLAWGSVVGSALQFGIQIPPALRLARGLRLGLDVYFAPVRQVLRNFGPVVVTRGVVQVSGFIDEVIASLLGASAMAAIGFAQTIYTLPVSLFGMSVAASELPQMASALGNIEEVHQTLRTRLATGLRQIMFFVIPTVVAFALIGDRLVGALYETGRFDREDTLFVWYILLGYTVGLLAVTLARLYSSAFYALHDTRTPFRFAILRVIIAAALGYLLAFPFRSVVLDFLQLIGLRLPVVEGSARSLGAIGLTAGAGVGSWIEFALLRGALIRRIGRPLIPPSFHGKIWVSALLGGAAGYGVAAVLPPLHPIWTAILAAGAFGMTYLLAATALRVQETRRVIKLIARR